MKQFWEKCNPNFAHVTLNGHLPGYEKVTAQWEQSFVRLIDFNDKIVIEYGIGGAYLGKYLFENKNIKKYIGFDIAKRSIETAKKTLDNYKDNCEFHLMSSITDRTLNDFSVGADIFITQACIQHFPTEEYLNNFLNALNNSSISTIMLQIRHGEKTICDGGTYDNQSKVVKACRTNGSDLRKILTKYKTTYQSDIYPKTNYQFFIFSL